MKTCVVKERAVTVIIHRFLQQDSDSPKVGPKGQLLIYTGNCLSVIEVVSVEYKRGKKIKKEI